MISFQFSVASCCDYYRKLRAVVLAERFHTRAGFSRRWRLKTGDTYWLSELLREASSEDLRTLDLTRASVKIVAYYPRFGVREQPPRKMA